MVRNVAAIVPPFETDASHHGTSAAIAFAVLSLNVRNILVLGHAQCGGIAAALDERLAAGVPFLSSWIDLLEPARAHSAHIHDGEARHTAMERDCIRRLTRAYPGVIRAVERSTNDWAIEIIN